MNIFAGDINLRRRTLASKNNSVYSPQQAVYTFPSLKVLQIGCTS
jgi:hypothetical protein